MKALTIRQPWASLTLMVGENGKAFKRVETRSYRTNYRGRIAIHAGATHEDLLLLEGLVLRHMGVEVRPQMVALPYGKVIGEVTIKDCIPINELWDTEYSTAMEVDFGDWSKGKGRFGWILEDPVMYDQPVPARGQLGLWNWPGR